MIKTEPERVKEALKAEPRRSYPRQSSGLRWLLLRTITGAIILVLLINTLPRVFIEIGHYITLFNEQQEQEYEKNFELARALGRTFDAFIQNVLHQEMVIGLALTSSQPLSSDQSMRILKISVQDNHSLRNYSWLSPEGEVITTSQPEVVEKNMSEHQFFRDIKEGKDWSVSSLIQRQIGNDTYFVVARGIRDEAGKLLGIVTSEIDPLLLDDELRFENAGQAAFVLIDSEGKGVYRFPSLPMTWEQRDWLSTRPVIGEALTGKEVSGIILDNFGQKRIASYVPIENIGWAASSSRSEDDVLAPIYQELARESGQDLFVFLLTVIASAAIGFYIIRPVRRLQNYAINLGSGKLSERVQVGGPGEMQELADTFNLMAAAIEIREKQNEDAREALRKTLAVLETRVQERTAELATANEELRNEMEERKRMEEQLRRAQRLETAGRIAGQVAHDFNNLLSPLMGYPELIKMYLPPDHPAIKYCDVMLESTQHMADINADLLTLSRRGHFNLEPIDLNHILRQALSNLSSLPDTMSLEIDLDEGLFPVNASAAQLVRVVTNLISNAREAMQDIGALKIETRNVRVEKPFGYITLIDRGEYSRLVVSDTGCGIPEEIRDKVFDPFFTTKRADRQRGSGLGLSIVQVIVNDLNGFIDFDSEIGKGTTFSVYLPACPETRNVETKVENRPGSEHILIVDDDQAQREVVKLLLQSLGYQIDIAISGEEAVSYIKERPVDLLILDMLMPGGIDGAETYRQVLEIREGQKAIILSGFAESERVHEALRLGAGAYVRKPVTRAKIAQAVREELDRAL